MDRLPDLSSLSHDEKDVLIHALWAQVQALMARVAELEARLGLPPKTPNNSSLPSSQGRKPNRDDKPARTRLSPLAHPGARTARRSWTRSTRRWQGASTRWTCRWSPRW